MTTKPDNKLAIVAYITFIGTIVAYFLNADKKDSFAAFHIRQAFGINLLQIVLSPLVTMANNLNVTLAFWVFCFTLWIYGFLGALNSRLNLIPLFGGLFQKWFTFVR